MKRQYAITSAVLCMAILAGCGKSDKESNVAVTTPGAKPETQAVPSQVPAAGVKNFSYYETHLEEAKQTMLQCMNMKPEEITPEIMARCKTATSAWQTQPYKPGSQN